MKKKPVYKTRPEDTIRDKIRTFMQDLGWFVKIIHGGKYQSGLPDLYCSHERYGIRWVEVKLPDMKGSKFTPKQMETFPKMLNNGSPIWILTAATEEEYKKLFQRCNCFEYMLMKF
jgi:hypothetical protein